MGKFSRLVGTRGQMEKEMLRRNARTQTSKEKTVQTAKTVAG